MKIEALIDKALSPIINVDAYNETMREIMISELERKLNKRITKIEKKLKNLNK